jgi:ATP-dependent RNA helicase DDX35
MAALTMAPRMARALVAAGPLGCAEEVITVIALLSVASLWVGASDRRRVLEESKQR